MYFVRNWPTCHGGHRKKTLAPAEAPSGRSGRTVFLWASCSPWEPGRGREPPGAQQGARDRMALGGQCDGSTPPPHPLLHVSEVCYQLVPSTPGDTSLRGLGVPRVSRNSSSPPPKLPTRSRVEHQLPVLAAPSWPSSLLRAGRPTHRHPVCPLPGYVRVCRQHSGLHSQFRTRRVSLGWPRCFLPPRIAVRTE